MGIIIVLFRILFVSILEQPNVPRPDRAENEGANINPSVNLAVDEAREVRDVHGDLINEGGLPNVNNMFAGDEYERNIIYRADEE